MQLRLGPTWTLSFELQSPVATSEQLPSSKFKERVQSDTKGPLRVRRVRRKTVFLARQKRGASLEKFALVVELRRRTA